MPEAKTEVVKDVIQTAAEQLLNFSERGATAYGDDVIRILKPLKDSELRTLANFFYEQHQLWLNDANVDLASEDDGGNTYYETQDALMAVEEVLDRVRCVEQMQGEIDRRAELAAKKPRLVK